MIKNLSGPRALILAAAVFCLVHTVRAQENGPDFSEVEKIAAQELKETNTPGAAIAIVKGDKIIYSKGIGRSDVETGAPVSPEMLFRIGSTSKMYTCAAILTLVQQGKLSLDEPVGTYIKNLSPKISKLTLRQLMTHTAGLKDEAPSFGLHDESVLMKTVTSWTDDYFFTEPGKVMSYSNPGFTLAGAVLEAAGGKPYATLVEELVLKPLGMVRSSFNPEITMTYPMSQGHDSEGKEPPKVVRPYPDNSGYWPAGFLMSSVLELSRFAIMYMNGGSIDGKQVFSPDLLAKLTGPYVDVPSQGAKYGFGLESHDFRGVRMVEHAGGIAGFGSLFKMIPDQKVAVIILANRSGVSLEKTSEKAFETLISLQPEEARKDLPLTDTDIKDLTGKYDLHGQSIDISSRDGKLFLKYAGNESQLTKVAADRFFFKPSFAPTGTTVAFVRDASGKVEFLHFGARALRKK